MSATVFVHFGDRGFRSYDIILGVFLKHLLEVAEATGYSHAPFLDEAIQHWRLAPNVNFGFHLKKSWTALQRVNVITFVEQACARLASRDSIPMEEIANWPFAGGSRLFHRGLKAVPIAPVIELGGAIISLLRDELPKAPRGEAWFSTDKPQTVRSESSIKKQDRAFVAKATPNCGEKRLENF